jgi:DNA polymerase-3 subunit gamma/tau
VQEIDAASNNGVDDVRALREAARYLPARDRYKIYIVDEVHMLSGAAFNALLKTLEEPPGHIKFLLATTDPQKLPATILSRVQRHNIQLVPLGKIVARLREIAQAENVQASDGALALVARQAQGSMRDALSLLDQLFSAHDPAAGEISDQEAAATLGALDTSVVRDTVAAVLAREAGGALSGVVRAYEQGADMKRLAEELAAHARNLVLASLPGVKQDLPDHEIRALAQEASTHDSAQLARVFELLQLAQDEVAKAASPRHALEVALLRAVYLAPAGSLPELVARVEALGAGVPIAKPLADPATPEPRKAPPGWGSRVLGSDAAPLRAAPTPPPTRDPDPDPDLERETEPELTPVRPPLDLQSRWRLLIESVRAARKPGVAAALEHAVPLRIDRAGVQIAFRKGAGHAAIVQEARAAVESAFEKPLGFRAPLQLVEQDAPADASVAQQRQKQRAAASEGRIALGREHPAVRAAVEVLGGEIEDVRDLGEE